MALSNTTKGIIAVLSPVIACLQYLGMSFFCNAHEAACDRYFVAGLTIFLSLVFLPMLTVYVSASLFQRRIAKFFAVLVALTLTYGALFFAAVWAFVKLK
jgi:hypothetical protein